MESVSIVVITYNEEKNIRTCLQSLVNLDYPVKNYEILVIDASTDNTKKVVKEFKDVKLINAPKNGYGFQRNLGISKAKHKLIAFTDADCIVPANWLTKLTNNLKGYDCVGGSTKHPPGTTTTGVGITCLGFPAGGALGIEHFGNLSTCNCLFKKNIFTKVGMFNELLIYGGEDSELMERVKQHGFSVKLDNNCYVYHKVRTFKNFLKWSFRRGIARYHLQKRFLHVFMPVTVIIYPFTKRFRTLIKRRRSIGINMWNIFTTVTFLFFMRQVCMSLGWFYGARQRLYK